MNTDEKSIAPFAFAEPTDLDQALRLAGELAKSSLLPDAYHGKPANVLAVMMKARELGLSVMQALTEMHVIKGKVVSSAGLKMALCLRRPDICLYFTLVESTSEQAVFETHRKGAPKPVQLKWTYAKAAVAGLPGRNPTWKAHPDEMLRARCMSALATAVYPDLVQGLLTGDEAADTVDGIVQDPSAEVKMSKTEALKVELTARPPLPPLPPKRMVIEDADTDPVKVEDVAAVATALKDAPPRQPVSLMAVAAKMPAGPLVSSGPLAPADGQKMSLVGKPEATPGERIKALCEQHGMKMSSVLKGCGIKATKMGELTAADVGLVRDAIEASHPPARDEPPPPGDDDAAPF